MNSHGIRYSEIDCEDAEKGCVEVYGCKLHNEIVSGLRRKIKQFANFQMEKNGKHPRKYLISLNGDSDLHRVRRYLCVSFHKLGNICCFQLHPTHITMRYSMIFLMMMVGRHGQNNG